MRELLNMEGYSSDYFLLFLFIIILCSVMIGYVTDIVMGDRGFGPLGNGLLITLALIVGSYVRNAFFGTMLPGDFAFTTLFTAATATIILMAFGIFKGFVR